MGEPQFINKLDQQLIAAKLRFELSKLYPNANIDVFVADQLGPHGEPLFAVEIDGERQPDPRGPRGENRPAFTIVASNETGSIQFPMTIWTPASPAAVLAKLRTFESMEMRVTIEKDGAPCTLSELEDAAEKEAT